MLCFLAFKCFFVHSFVNENISDIINKSIAETAIVTKQWQENYPSDVAIFDLIELKNIKAESKNWNSRREEKKKWNSLDYFML